MAPYWLVSNFLSLTNQELPMRFTLFIKRFLRRVFMIDKQMKNSYFKTLKSTEEMGR
jgi:hypothetical protein